MSAGMPWRVAIGKELRALLPMWAAAMVSLALTSVAWRIGWNPVMPVFVLSTFTLGAVSIGHEYSSGTLATLLALPVSRTQLMAAKLAALLTLLIPLAALMFAVMAGTVAPFRFAASLGGNLVVLALGMSLFVAPWMSMVARGPLGGVVFTTAVLVGVPAATLLWQRLIGEPPDAGLRLAPGAYVVVALTSGVLGWRAFARLEAIDGARDFRVSARSDAKSAARAVSRRPALLALAIKELQLQQMTFIVASLSLVLILLLVWAEQHHYAFARGLSYPMSVLHFLIVPILAGALASAEERSLGTLDWQTLQPVAAWKQWAIKLGVALGLAAALGVGGPALLVWVDRGADLALYSGGRPPVGAAAAEALGGAVSVSLALAFVSAYVSSFSTSGLRAAIVAVPVIVGFGWLGVFVLAPLGPTVSAWPLLTKTLSPMAWRLHHGRLTLSEMVYARWLITGVGGVSVAIFVGLLLKFGLINHRASRVDLRALVRQASAIALWAVISTVSLAATSAWYWTGTPNYPTPAERQATYDAIARHQRWQASLERLVAGFSGRVGVSVSDGIFPIIGVNDRKPLPMQSVMKLPVAVAVLRKVDRGELRLDEPVLVRKEDLSVYVQPIAKLVGPDGFKTTIDDLIRRAIVDSDNAAADILIARLGGPATVRTGLSFDQIRIDRDEKHLQSDINGLEWRPEYVDPAAFERAVASVPPDKRDAAFQAYLRDERDTSTPLAMTILLEFLSSQQNHLLSPESRAHLLDILQQTTTTPDRLKAGVPAGWTIGHKSGTSGDWRGVNAATNDVGIITGPAGEKIYISVFIAESRASAADRAALIANIARTAIENYK
jgi:beta-lactamase class A